MKLVVMRNGKTFEVSLRLQADGKLESIAGVFKEINNIGVTVKSDEIMLFDGSALYKTDLYVRNITPGLLSYIYSGTGIRISEPTQNKIPDTILVSDGTSVRTAKMFSYKQCNFTILGGYTSDDYPAIKNNAGCLFLYSLHHDVVPMAFKAVLSSFEIDDVLLTLNTFNSLECVVGLNQPKQPPTEAIKELGEGDIVFAPSLSKHQHTVEVDDNGVPYILVNNKPVYFDENGRLENHTHRTVFPAHLKADLEQLLDVELHYSHNGYTPEEAENFLTHHLETIIMCATTQAKEGNTNFESKIQESVEAIKQFVLE